jgi:hypothetical protein
MMNDKLIKPFFCRYAENKMNSMNIAFGSNGVLLLEGQVFRIRTPKDGSKRLNFFISSILLSYHSKLNLN